MDKWQDVRFQITTPMFMGRYTPPGDGKERHHKDHGEFRIRSLRGALRFWFRFAVGPMVNHDLTELKKLEQHVFGPDSDVRTVEFRLAKPIKGVTERRPSWVRDRTGRGPDLRYLLGQGLLGYKKGEGNYLKRAYLEPTNGFEHVLKVRYGPHRDVIVPLLWLLQTFGGLGAKTRRGWGGIRFEVDKGWAWPDELASYVDAEAMLARAVGKAVPERTTERPPFSSMSGWSYYYVGPPATDWMSGLDDLGATIRELRANMQRGNDDFVTEEYLNVIVPYFRRNLARDTVYAGAGLGLPAYFRSLSTEKDATVEARLKGDKLRRASMLWSRLHVSDSGIVPTLSLMESDVLPDEAELHVTSKHGKAARVAFSHESAIERAKPV